MGDLYACHIKRALDFTGAAIGVVVLAPVMAGVAVAIRVTMGAPVLFRQQRPGKDEEPFELVKFRTMGPAPEGADLHVGDESERLTTIGRFLRRTSLDELPQLWNVLRGEMSLIGPRPLMVCYLPYYTQRERARHSVRPGITGLAQTQGRNNLDWDDHLALDIEYVDRLTARADLAIMLATIRTVLRPSDVTVPGSGMPWFDEHRRRQRRGAAETKLEVAETEHNERITAT